MKTPRCRALFEGLEPRRLLTAAGSGLIATYFDEPDLSGPTVVRTDAAIDFNWANASPVAGIAPLYYSVRWEGEIEAAHSETYTFYSTTNDGVRLWVNGRQLIDDWQMQGTSVNTGKIALRAGERYSIRMEFFQNRGQAVAQLEWESPSQARQIIPTSQLYPVLGMETAGSGTGLAATFFDELDFGGTTVARADEVVDFAWQAAGPASGIGGDTFSARWQGQIQPRYSETYTFHATGDDEVRLWVNGQLLIGDPHDEATGLIRAKASDVLGIASGQTALWYGSTVTADDVIAMHTYYGDANLSGAIDGDDFFAIDQYVGQSDVGHAKGDFNNDGHVDGDDYWIVDRNYHRQAETFVSGTVASAPPEIIPQTKTGEIQLIAGQKYDIRLEYNEAYGDASAQLEWSSANQEREVVPATQLYNAITPAPPASLPGEWDLIFRDEFNGTVLDPVWHPAQYWDHEHTIVGQGELQAYDASGASVSDGLLKLTARPDAMYGTDYVSGLVQTGGDDWIGGDKKFSFTYGYMEVRAKLPEGQGLWGAIWMMPASHDDDNGELDVLEVIGSDINRANFNLHRHGMHDGHEWLGPDFSEGFHTFGVDWQPDYVAWYVDGVERARTTDPAYICPEAMYPILNLAVGGDWPGSPDASTVFPATMEVDYVRVWQRPE